MGIAKGLLLGSAAGFVAMTGAYAADLPVKAKPVQYVKICNLYGPGFYYVPGTEMCLKVGGFARADATWGFSGNPGTGPWAGTINNRTTSDLVYVHRGYITADSRSQTEYGTARGFLAVGLSTPNAGATASTFNASRAFIQWAGFTFGQATSFFEFHNGFFVSYGSTPFQSDTGDQGHGVAAYTAQFGNGVSATVSAEVRRITQIVGQGATATTLSVGTITGGGILSAYGGWQVPDIVGNLRIDQSWGGAQIMGALHHVNGLYYGTNESTAAGLGPSDKWGFAVGAGVKFNLPMIGPRDFVQAQVVYTEGALRYIQSAHFFNIYRREGSKAGYGVLSDAVYGAGATPATTGTALQLTTGWAVNASYNHVWNQAWQTSIYGGWGEVNYNATANAILCALEGAGTGAGTTATATAGCNNNWSMWWLASRTQWNVSSDFYIGLDVAYMNLTSATLPAGVATTAVNPAGVPAGVTPGDVGAWTVKLRIEKSFAPGF